MTADLRHTSTCSPDATFRPDPDPGTIERLAPRPGELILDIGCGDGKLSALIAQAGARIIGLDSSQANVEAARALGVDAFLADSLMFDPGAQADRFGQFDAIFSNSAFLAVTDPDAAATGIFQALKPDGRFVGEIGGQGDLELLWSGFRAELEERGHKAPDRSDHWRPDVEEFARLHFVAGFTEVVADRVERPVILPQGIRGWVVADRSADLDQAMIPQWEREEIAASVERRLEGRLMGADGQYRADHVRLRFSMKKPG